MRLVKISLFLLIVVLFGVWITSAQSTVTITGTTRQLTTDPLGQLDPAISGDLVVYTDQRNGNDDIYFVNAVTGVETQVTTSTLAQRAHDICGTRIVYSDLTPPTRRIRLYDVTTGATSVVGSGPLDQNPRIDGDIVVFERGLGAASDIYAVNLATNTEILVSDSPAAELAPVVSGTRVVYWRFPSPFVDGDIILFDLATGTETVLGFSAVNERDPDIDGNLVVWNVVWSFEDADIAIHDLSTGMTQILARPGLQRAPHISGDFIAFDDYPDGNCGTCDGNVMLYHIPTGTFHPVAINPGAAESLNDISGKRIAYNSTLSGNNDIWLYTLQLPEIDVAPPTHNFGNIGRGSSAATVITVSNLGAQSLTVSGVAFEAGSSPAFTLTTSLSLPIVIAPGGTRDLPVAFTPTATGLAAATLSITSNDLDDGVVQVALSGLGTQTAPSAVLDVNPQTVGCHELVTFDGGRSVAPGDSVVQYSWDFGDGTGVVQTTTPSIQHTYQQFGIYHASLVVTDNLGSLSRPELVAVRHLDNNAPSAVIDAPATIGSGQTVNFSGGRSNDPDGACGSQIVSWTWQVDTGGPVQMNVPTISSSLFAAQLTEGTHTLTLIVRDDSGNDSHSTSQHVTVSGRPSAVLDANPETVGCHGTVTFDGSRSVATPGNPVVQYSWDFADETGVVQTTTPSIQHTYQQFGTYHASLVVTDNLGSLSRPELVAVRHIDNNAPSAVIDAPATIGSGQTVNFSGGRSSDPDVACGSRIVSWTWQVDMGSPVQMNVPTISSSLFAAQLTQGTHILTLTVRDDAGNQGIPENHRLVVEGTFNQSPIAVDDGATTNQNTPVMIAVLANDSDPDGDALRVTNTSQGHHGAVVINTNNTVTYEPNTGFTGIDTFTYTVSDGRGGSASATVTVTVSPGNRPPTAVCQNLTRTAAANCHTAVTAQQVGGYSSDPDGDDITLALTPSGPFNVGTHLVTLTVTDSRGASSSCIATVTVVDNSPPSINCPSNIVVGAALGHCSAGVNYAINATDTCSTATVTCIPPSGSSFNAGTTIVVCASTDASGNTANCSFSVIVNDAQLPTITCPPNVTAAAQPGSNSVIVNYAQPQAADNCSGATIVCLPPAGSSFPTGVTPVNCTVTDGSNNRAQCSFTVTVTANPALADKIAFETNRDGNLEIYSMNPDGTNATRLTFNSALDFNPAWSADRSKIAFTSGRTGNGDIYVMNADGTNQTRLTSTPAIEDDASWSPDGTKIAFWSSRDGNPEIYVMNANGSNQSRITSHALSDTQPQWSPDGAKLIFVSNRNNLINFDIYVMNADGSNVTRLTTNASIDESPDWSPDGLKIVFTSNRSNLLDFEIWVMNVNGSNQTRLTTSTLSSVRPSWSRDGTQISFATNRNGLLNFEIYTMSANGSGQTRLTTNSAMDFNPDR